mmetsp:Transcript_12899/g.41345  ORF Transcript_12899/g.41345 Transcript_12899/m.41345 type:complete len:231 (+) Transcript_12899:820-1512(+)
MCGCSDPAPFAPRTRIEAEEIRKSPASPAHAAAMAAVPKLQLLLPSCSVSNFSCSESPIPAAALIASLCSSLSADSSMCDPVRGGTRHAVGAAAWPERPLARASASCISRQSSETGAAAASADGAAPSFAAAGGMSPAAITWRTWTNHLTWLPVVSSRGDTVSGAWSISPLLLRSVASDVACCPSKKARCSSGCRPGSVKERSVSNGLPTSSSAPCPVTRRQAALVWMIL